MILQRLLLHKINSILKLRNKKKSTQNHRGVGKSLSSFRKNTRLFADKKMFVFDTIDPKFNSDSESNLRLQKTYIRGFLLGVLHKR